ncbi:MAG TPA: ComEC/Rec2 family competence protein, partial [Pyrinomonadaceae bacterium]
GEPEFARDRVILSLSVETIKTSNQILKSGGVISLQAWLRQSTEQSIYRELDMHHRSHMVIHTRLDRSDKYRNPGVSTLTEYLDRKDYDAIGLISDPRAITTVSAAEGVTIAGLVYRWRERLQHKIDSQFSSETAGVLDAALLGSRHNLSYATAERFREGGTFHVLVISGAHISVIGGLILLLARRLTSRRWLQFVCSALIVWCYALAVGADASVVRAALMFSFLVLGGLLYRKTSPLNSLGAAALVLLVWRPKDIFDPAFQLTFLSVLAILVVAWPILRTMSDIGRWHPTRESPYPPACSALRSFSEALYWSENGWRREIEKRSHSYRLLKSPAAPWLERHHLQRVLRYTFAAIVVSTAVQVVLLPLQIIYFHRLSWSSPILTLVVGILLAALAIVALVALILSQIQIGVAAPFFKLADALDWLMIHSVDPFAGLGIASIRIAEYSDWAGLVYVSYYVSLCLLAVALSLWNPLASPVTNPSVKSRLFVLVCLQFVLFVSLVASPKNLRYHYGLLELNFLDVGQGDAALVTMPDGTTLLIDGGGRPGFAGGSDQREYGSIGERVVSEYLWSRGLGSIDYVLATHADADHIDGLNDVVRNFRVRSAIVGRQASGDPEYAKFAETLGNAGVATQVVQAGDVLRFGPVEVEILWPPADGNSGSPSSNDDSVVVRIKFGERSCLFTGDIEKAAEVILLTSPGRLPADVVKVPHHGSRSSSTPAFVSAVQPSLAIISVGRTSMFGHPHKEVVERWQAIGAEVLTTGQSGTITVTTDGTDMTVIKFVREQ